jgi:endogenous inhibitor of DNA gyrase (YacG/DUF329 family)
MRPHLKACLLLRWADEAYSLFCTCKQPEFGNMISCDECGDRVAPPVNRDSWPFCGKRTLVCSLLDNTENVKLKLSICREVSSSVILL